MKIDAGLRWYKNFERKKLNQRTKPMDREQMNIQHQSLPEGSQHNLFTKRFWWAILMIRRFFFDGNRMEKNAVMLFSHANVSIQVCIMWTRTVGYGSLIAIACNGNHISEFWMTPHRTKCKHTEKCNLLINIQMNWIKFIEAFNMQLGTVARLVIFISRSMDRWHIILVPLWYVFIKPDNNLLRGKLSTSIFRTTQWMRLVTPQMKPNMIGLLQLYSFLHNVISKESASNDRFKPFIFRIHHFLFSIEGI